MAEYTFILNLQGPEKFTLKKKISPGITRIGRQAGNDIVLPHTQVSRAHARLEATTSELHLEDLNSSNGSFVNNKKLSPNTPILLKDGDAVKFGPFTGNVKYSKIARSETREQEKPVIDPSVVSKVEPAPEDDEKPAPEKTKPPARKTPTRKPAAKIKPEGEAARKTATPKSTPARRQKPPAKPPAPPPAAAVSRRDDFEPLPPGLSRHSQKLLKFLPGIYHTDFMARFLGMFEATLLPIEWTIDNFDSFLHADTSPEGFLPWLSSWFDIQFDSTWTESKKRMLLKDAHTIYARRGTRWALHRVLQIYIGVEPEIDDQTKSLDPFTFLVHIPLRKQAVKPDLIEALIDAHKPAHTTYKVRYKA